MTKTKTNLGFCTVCDQILSNPCVPSSDFIFEGLSQTPMLIPATVAVIRAEPRGYYQTRAFACKIGRHLDWMKMPEREVRNYVSYKIGEGLSQSIRYEAAWGEEIVFLPETVDEMFDNRKAEHRSAESFDWTDELISSDRAFGDLKTRAVNGQIRTLPDKRWLVKFMLIHLAMKTPSSNVQVDD